jgi:hypothetical protein
MLMLTADRFKVRLELARGPQQLIALGLHFLGVLLVLMSTLDEGQHLLPCLLSIGDCLLMSDAKIHHFATKVGHPLLRLRKPRLGCVSPPCLL